MNQKRNTTIYSLVFALIIVNVVLIYNVVSIKNINNSIKKRYSAISESDYNKDTKFNEIEYLYLSSINKKDTMRVDVKKYSLYYFVGKNDCAKCVQKSINYLEELMKKREWNIRYLPIAVDFDQSHDFMKKYMDTLKTYRLVDVGFKYKNNDYLSPFLLLTDDRGRIMLSKQLKSDEDVETGLFWGQLRGYIDIISKCTKNEQIKS